MSAPEAALQAREAAEPGLGLQRGMTLVELMVSVALALLVTLAALAVLLFSRQGGSAMEQAATLRDNARFGTELVRRIVMQAGFESPTENTSTNLNNITSDAPPPAPDVSGRDNTLVAAGTDPQVATNGNRTSACGTVVDSRCVNGSDVLIVRYQGTTDGSMINCAGVTVGDALVAADRPMSAFHVRVSASGEPTLTCTYRKPDGTFTDVELIEGVETFQVLYGVDGVAPGAATTTPVNPEATLVTRYLRADEMSVAGNDSATQDNWRRVRAIRIGMILRGPPGSAISNAGGDLYPLGEKLFNPADAFSKFPIPIDGRLRQEVTFTVHLRNVMGLGAK